MNVYQYSEHLRCRITYQGLEIGDYNAPSAQRVTKRNSLRFTLHFEPESELTDSGFCVILAPTIRVSNIWTWSRANAPRNWQEPFLNIRTKIRNPRIFGCCIIISISHPCRRFRQYKILRLMGIWSCFGIDNFTLIEKLLSQSESVKIYWLSVKFDWFK